MKKINFLYLLILPFVFTSCDFFSKFDHFSAGNTFEESFSVAVTPGISDSFSNSVEFAVTDDSTISDNINEIESFDVNEISYKITDFNGDEFATAQGEITITSAGRPIGDPVSISENFGDLYASGGEMSLPLTNGTLTALKEAYLNNETLSINVSASYLVNKKTTFEFTVYMSIEALIQIAN